MQGGAEDRGNTIVHVYWDMTILYPSHQSPLSCFLMDKRSCILKNLCNNILLKCFIKLLVAAESNTNTYSTSLYKRRFSSLQAENALISLLILQMVTNSDRHVYNLLIGNI